MILLAFLPVIAGIINNRLQYGRDFGDRVSFYCYISIMVAYAITILLEIIFTLFYWKTINMIKIILNWLIEWKLQKYCRFCIWFPDYMRLHAILDLYMFAHLEKIKIWTACLPLLGIFIKPNRKPIELKDFLLKIDN